MGCCMVSTVATNVPIKLDQKKNRSITESNNQIQVAGNLTQNVENDQVMLELTKNNEQKDFKTTIKEQIDIDKNKSQEIIHQASEEKNKPPEEEIKVMLLGQGGVGKKRLLSSLRETIIELGEFKECKYTYKEKKFCIVGTPDFEMEDDIDVREQRITQFQSYFDKCKKLKAMLILVNFERTDLMKKKVMSVFKFMRKFKNKMLLAITQFELSENKEADQKHLEEKLKHFINDERMIFLAKDDSDEVKKKIYDKACIQLDKEATTLDEELDFKDTLFEKLDEKEQMKMMDDLNQAIGYNRSK